ncbi:MAG: dephospho-CoA kinase [Anaerolineae bacterium]|nr:dephospho-CoA kinase [Anaerolineae bacterium]
MSRWPNKYVIGLTGNIATGKSVVRQMLQHSGAYTIDADSLAHQVMMPGAPAYKPIVDMFGKSIIGPDGRINRGMLGQIVFANPDLLKKLEEITHPIIRQGINALAGRATQRVVVIEAIKLLETDLHTLVDAVWVVDAKPQTQYQRLVAKRKMSEAEAKQRIMAQGPQGEKLKRAAVVIDNNGNVEETWKQVQQQWNEIRKLLSAAPAQAQPATAPTPTPPAPPKAATAAPAQSQPQPQAQSRPVAPAPPAPPRPAPTPTPAASIDAPEVAVDVSGVMVKRGSPANAQDIATFITAASGRQVSRMDIMMNFGQKSYLVAHDKSQAVIGVMGWTVENLVTRMDEFYVGRNIPAESIIHALIVAVEAASKELQSEVSFFFLPMDAPPATLKAYAADGYAPIALKDIKIPAWREAVEETLREHAYQVYWKQLRKDRVLQPI